MHFPFTMPPLLSGGVMLTYRCNHACRHCLYRCGPHLPDAWMDMVTMEKVFTALAREKQLADLHLAGGEATLNVELLVEAIRMATRMGVRLSYLETNASFADGMDQAVGILEKLHEAGLRTILISISPYHNEFTPLQKAFTCIEAGRRVFGDNRVFPWRDHFLAALGNMDIQQTHTLEKSLSHMGMRDGARELLQLFPLTPGGRVTQALRNFYSPQPAGAFAGRHCRDILTNTTHFHLDPHGNLFTGHCPGIVTAQAPELHPPLVMDASPIFATLCAGGPHALARLAEKHSGFKPREDGYISPCDLCLDARSAIRRTDPEGWTELRPDAYYFFV